MAEVAPGVEGQHLLDVHPVVDAERLERCRRSVHRHRQPDLVRGDALAHLQRLALSWRLLADLSFADLLLLAPIADEDGHRFVVLAQVRPTTGQTLYVTDLVGRVMWFLPNVFVALLILAFGAYFAKFVGDAVSTYGRNAGIQDVLLLGKIAQYAILLFVVLIALDQIKVGGDIVRQSFLIILGGVVMALALAFGLAGKDWAADRIEQWWPRSRLNGRANVREVPRRDVPPPVPPPSVWPQRSTRDDRPHP